MYIHDHYASLTRPVKELKGFELIELQQGESREVSFLITEDILKFYGAQNKWEAESGDFTIYIGSNSATKRNSIFHLN